MGNFVVTNISIYRAIADEAYQKMAKLLEEGQPPNPDGSPGRIKIYDPTHSSFKQSMISIVFSGMWLEAKLHLLLVKKYGKAEAKKKHDRKSYEDKLQLLDCNEKIILDSVARFRAARKALVHENAHFDAGNIWIVQDEAKNTHDMLAAIDKQL